MLFHPRPERNVAHLDSRSSSAPARLGPYCRLPRSECCPATRGAMRSPPPDAPSEPLQLSSVSIQYGSVPLSVVFSPSDPRTSNNHLFSVRRFHDGSRGDATVEQALRRLQEC